MTTKYIYIEADLHSNNKWGLLQPGTMIEEITPYGESYIEEPLLNPEQEFLLAVRNEALKGVKKIVGKNKVNYVFVGDAHQGNKHVTQYVSQLSSAQSTIMIENFRPVFKKLNIDKSEFIFGTEAHDGMGHTNIKSLVNALRQEFQRTKLTMSHHTDIDVDGYVINVAHHGASEGSRRDLRGNAMRLYLKGIMDDYEEMGKTPPNLVIRGHFHGYHWETIRRYKPAGWQQSDSILIPSLCGMGAYGRQATRSRSNIINGSLLLEIEDGRLVNIHDFIMFRDIVKKEYW